MSESYTYIISADPRHRLSEDTAVQVLELLRRHILPDTTIAYEQFSQLRFIDSGQNFSQVCCPYCNKVITDWWSAEMERCHSSGFSDLYVVVPCCQLTTMLSQLQYSWLCGFAGYAFRIGKAEKRLSSKLLTEIEALIGTGLVLIYQHV